MSNSDNLTILPGDIGPTVVPTPSTKPVFSRLTPISHMQGNEAIGYLIREMQRCNGWTNVRAAAIIGLEERNFRHLKAGDRSPYLETFLRIANASGCRVFIELPERPL